MTVITRRRMRTIPLSAALLGVAFVAPTGAHAVTPSEVRSLRGLPGVEVVVERLDGELQALGLSAEQLRGVVESRLRESGVTVLTAQERPPGRPWLYVRVFGLKSSNVPLVSFFVSFQLRQDVSLDRNPDFHTGGTTWDLGSVGLGGVNAIASAVQETSQDLATRFASDFSTANPNR